MTDHLLLIIYYLLTQIRSAVAIHTNYGLSLTAAGLTQWAFKLKKSLTDGSILFFHNSLIGKPPCCQVTDKSESSLTGINAVLADISFTVCN